LWAVFFELLHRGLKSAPMDVQRADGCAQMDAAHLPGRELSHFERCKEAT
jgi:hypothetical protein